MRDEVVGCGMAHGVRILGRGGFRKQEIESESE